MYVPEKVTIAELMSQELDVHQKLITKVIMGDIIGMIYKMAVLLKEEGVK